MSKKLLLGIGALVLVVALVWVVMGGDNSQPQVDNTNTETEQEETAGEVHELTIAGGNYYYTTDEIRVKKGDTVRITFSSEEGFHDLVLDEFDVATERYRPGEGEETVEFVADQAGEFEYYCSVGDHREKGQVGTLIVEE
ncbi:MAG: cupredoxin domain-containing protein [Candidatus Spechtbacterales bacterium]|nr:cupredoxin domain-containing protein [Candidatus Spechtbacterales bacterium]